MLNGVLQGQDASLALSLISHIGVLLSHSYHDTSVPGAANNGGEDSSRSVIAGKASFAHARAIVNDQSGDFFVTHVELG